MLQLNPLPSPRCLRCARGALLMYWICTATSQADVIQQRDRIQAEFNTLEDRCAQGEGEAGRGVRAGGQVRPRGDREGPLQTRGIREPVA